MIFDQAREDARLEPYLTWREKLARAAALLPLALAGAVLSTLQGTAPRSYLLLGAIVWVLATAWLFAAVTVRLRRRARQRRRAALRARRREAHDHDHDHDHP